MECDAAGPTRPTLLADIEPYLDFFAIAGADWEPITDARPSVASGGSNSATAGRW